MSLYKSLLLISSVVASFLFTACDNTQHKSSVMETHQSHSDKVYTCSMHPEVKGKKGEKCPKCGMDLVPVPGENSAKYEVTLATSPQIIEAGTPAKLTFAFTENDQNAPLDILHEMKVHLIVVDEGLTWFRHIHPEEQADGSYAVSETFPNGGKYFLFADYKPRGATSIVDKKVIEVKGNTRERKIDDSNKFVSVVDGYTVTLENGNDFKSNRAQSFEISVEKDGKKLSEKEIEPYLASTAHIAMISKADKDFLHIHPMSDKRFPIYAETLIKKPGIYRAWVEFKTNGKVHAADFTINVSKGDEDSKGGENHMHHH